MYAIHALRQPPFNMPNVSRSHVGSTSQRGAGSHNSSIFCRSVMEVPLTGFLETCFQNAEFCVSVNDARVNDPRDGDSLYANVRNSCQRRTVFNFILATGGFFLQAADIRTSAGPVANGWSALKAMHLLIQPTYTRASTLDHPKCMPA